MYIYSKVDFGDFYNAFLYMHRGDQYSYEGLRALFNHLEEYAESSETPLELDVIAICCEFAELEVKHIERETGYADVEELEADRLVIHVDDDTIIYSVL